MTQMIRDIMTRDPICLPTTASAADAAKAMRDANVGPIIVLDEGENICGIVTDRDIAIRVVAEGRDPQETRLSEFLSGSITTLTPDKPVDEAVKIMRQQAIRRLPVVENGGKPIGIISIGDLAIEKDPGSALADISEAPPNN